MTAYDFTSKRVYVEADLRQGAVVPASAMQANYLRNVLRLRDGTGLLIFNGRDGEWQARLSLPAKRSCDLVVEMLKRPQSGGPDIHYLFAPLKKARLDYIVQKATELGAARITPVLTRHTNLERVNVERMRANVIEAAEQCGILTLPDVETPRTLDKVLADWSCARPLARTLILCDEEAPIASPVQALAHLKHATPVAVLIGPEGGFSPEERASILALDGVVRLSLGPRILRADTAAVAALTLINATLGDWV